MTLENMLSTCTFLVGEVTFDRHLLLLDRHLLLKLHFCMSKACDRQTLTFEGTFLYESSVTTFVIRSRKFSLVLSFVIRFVRFRKFLL